MDPSKVLFVGGNPATFASVQIRCVDIARHLGCDFQLQPERTDKIHRGYSAYIFVKPGLQRGEHQKLNQMGLIVWDIIDRPPPRSDHAAYIVSTGTAKGLFTDHANLTVIPHHHCNYDGKPNPASRRRPGWVGTQRWQPEIPGLDYDTYLTDGMTREDVVKAHRQIGIGLNLRKESPDTEAHVLMNSGIKLINCLGFGTPSVSSDEPAYREIGGDCTLFADLASSASAVQWLKTDRELYQRLRASCLAKAGEYHIEAIAARYRALIASL